MKQSSILQKLKKKFDTIYPYWTQQKHQQCYKMLQKRFQYDDQFQFS